MREYWGLQQIRVRLGYADHKSVLREYREHGLPMFKRRHGIHPRLVWYSCEPLVLAYQLARVQVQRQDMLGQNEDTVSGKPGQAR